jgi:hypothetical protein
MHRGNSTVVCGNNRRGWKQHKRALHVHAMRPQNCPQSDSIDSALHMNAVYFNQCFSGIQYYI